VTGDSQLIRIDSHPKTEQFIVRFDPYRPRQRQGHPRTRIETLAVLDIDTRPNTGTLKKIERLSM
jgi:hypothetical protein